MTIAPFYRLLEYWKIYILVMFFWGVDEESECLVTSAVKKRHMMKVGQVKKMKSRKGVTSGVGTF